MKSQKERLWLAIDQGGHATRALVFSADGHLLHQESAEIATHRVGQCVEHQPEEVVASIHAVLERIAYELGSDITQIAAAGIATQRSSIVCWDVSTGNALSPVISWQDTRAAQWLSEFDEHQETVRRLTGLPLSAHYGASKFRWCLENIPEVALALRRETLAWGPLASYLVAELVGGAQFIDPANASRTLLWDIATGEWSDELLKLFSLPRRPLPKCVPSSYDFGTIELGKSKVRLGVLTGDQSAAFYAFGPPQKNIAYINIGTGAFIQRWTAAELRRVPRLLSSVTWSDKEGSEYVIEGTVNGAGSALSALGLDSPELISTVSDNESGLKPPLFLNGVSGVGSPYWIPDFPSRFVGDGSDIDKTAAVLESIAFLLQINLDLIDKSCGAAQKILVSGGLSKSNYLCQCLASLSGRAVERFALAEASAYGLAFLMSGGSANWSRPSAERIFEPRAADGLKKRFAQWCLIVRETWGEGHAHCQD